ncbi:MAG: hypothetical protein L6R39_003117 [Caloplaca ligustica]|nr:MAG: hypothetical protein L6R39_003117 [Caloplaca ligustica]
MSLDLLQAFGDPSGEEPANPWATSDVRSRHPIEDDDFGEFEQPEPSEPPAQPTTLANEREAPTLPTNHQQDGLLINTALTRPPPSPSFQKANASLKLAIPPEPDNTTPTKTNPDESTPITAWPSSGRNRAKSLGKLLPLSPYVDDDDDDWGDFEETSPVNNASTETAERKAPQTLNPPQEPAEQTGFLLDTSDAPQKQTNSSSIATKPSRTVPLEPAAPSNIPPPSILLSIITTILQSLPAQLRDIVSKTSTALMAHANPNNNDIPLETLTAKLAEIRASARIVAGRKLRWKRDTHLAQSMRIGPANAGKAGGMKLTGVDRTETRREDQEAAEVVRLWKQQVGGLKSHVARINAQQSEVEFVLPDIAENMPVRVAKVGEGALTAAKCCFLCGLKRDEKVARLDVNVEDSFGEWWVDHWGHVDCIRFWDVHEDSLRQH